jgi:hypothetical protein
LMRWTIHNWMQSNRPGAKWLKQVGLPRGETRETFWNQTFHNEYSAKARLREALTGTGLMLAFLAWQNSHSTADDDAEKRPFAMFVTGAGPANKTMRDSWTKRGYEPYSLHVIVNGEVRVAIPTTRAGQIFAYPMGIAAALDDVAWKHKQNRALGKDIKTPIADDVLSGIATYYNIVGAQGIFQSAGHISQLSQGGGGMARAIGVTAASTAAALAIPGKSLLQGVTDMVYGAVDRSSLEASMMANVPVVNAMVNGRAINRFGDPIGDRSWYAMLYKLGAPIAIRVADTPENKKLYQMILDKGTAPPDLRRYIVEEKYGPLTQEQWNRFSKISGESLKKQALGSIDQLAAPGTHPQSVHQFMVNAADAANNEAAAALGLTPVPKTTVAGVSAGSAGSGSAGNAFSLPTGPKLSSLALPPASIGSGRGSMAGVPTSPSSLSTSLGAPARISAGSAGSLGKGSGMGLGVRRASLGRTGRSGGTLGRLGRSGSRIRAPRLVSGKLRARSGHSSRRIRMPKGRSRSRRLHRIIA